MLQSLIGKIVLAPFSLLYGLAISLRNSVYDIGLVKATKFSLPVISIGNLSIGGAGKTPHIEYLIRLLNPYINVATLSRGYKRKTKGFRFVKANDNVLDAGDEPLMYARKYKGIVVAVGESRATAIPQMVGSYPQIQTILLDDAFQHRSIDPDLNILLTTYASPFTRDYLLPSGRLREWRSAYKRADIIIISKCPEELSFVERSQLIQEVQPERHQKVYFSYYEYGHPYSYFQSTYRLPLDASVDVLLISAIANTDYLLDYLEGQVGDIQHLNYADHHLFSDQDMEYIEKVFSNMPGKRKILLTTEKDAMRLDLHRQKLIDGKLPLFLLPLRVKFHDTEDQDFDTDIKDFLLRYQV